ncbi:MAG: TIGR02301 family protein [Hyphomicrobiaceae bacterium]|nr:TIGR02301 family protein [Hyphomicrobiaceae bacterium]
MVREAVRLVSGSRQLLLAMAVCAVIAETLAIDARAQGTTGGDSGAPPAGLSQTPPKPGDTKPYDDKLMRLAEILGAVHYLRELCGQDDRQQWRERMREILDADGGSALRKAMLTRGFNNGYRSYGRTYQSCSPTAQTAIGRFLAEGAQIADGLVKTVP